jgi:hypothetical protein
MRASAVRAAIITAIEGEALDSKVGPGDKIKVLRQAREPESVTERIAMVRLLSLGRDDANTCDAHHATYQVSIFYAPSPDIDDRVASDAERLHDPLWSLHDINADVMVSEPGDVSIEEDVGRIVSRRDVRVIYRRNAL